VSDTVTVQCADDAISFEVKDGLVEVVTTFRAAVVSENTDQDIETDLAEPCTILYALGYLRPISGAAGLTPRVSLSCFPDFPLLVRYELSEGGLMRFYQAPKVEEDEP
jgi:hypothetical protein